MCALCCLTRIRLRLRINTHLFGTMYICVLVFFVAVGPRAHTHSHTSVFAAPITAPKFVFKHRNNRSDSLSTQTPRRESRRGAPITQMCLFDKLKLSTIGVDSYSHERTRLKCVAIFEEAYIVMGRYMREWGDDEGR